MDIVRNDDGTLVVPVIPDRHATDEDAEVAGDSPTTRVLHPGEGGYDEALAAWDEQENPDREAAVSTASGRDEAMAVVHAVATAPEHDVQAALDTVDDPAAVGEALRHVLVGGVHAVEDFATETAAAEGGEPVAAHTATKIIGEVLAELE
ncbi:MAG TPA: hypothetical protein VFU93_02720 [Acidimicrobiales bacterium]|nr:hypothetical protein [Acidimicrobiales bacterium]